MGLASRRPMKDLWNRSSLLHELIEREVLDPAFAQPGPEAPKDPGRAHELAPTQVAAESLGTAPTDLMTGPQEAYEATAPHAPSGAVRRGARYQHQRLLGKGGMGRVELVWDRDLMRHLALKEALPGFQSKREHLQLFLLEAQLTAYLDHPNIVPVHDLGLGVDGSPYFLMKHIEGRSLQALLDRARREEEPEGFSLKQRLRSFLQVCQGVSYAHQRGILHRDLKPDNIMLGGFGEVVLMDWGLAMPLRHAPDFIQALFEVQPPIPAGTPAYMSPEQAKGEVQGLEASSDLYSLGVILYQLLTLSSPYRDDGTLIEQVKQARYRPLFEVKPDLAPSLAAVVEKCLASAPSQRYGSVALLHQDLERVMDGLPSTTEELSLLRRAYRFYTHTDPRFGQMRVVEIDLLIGGGLFAGLGMGLYFGEFWRSGTIFLCLGLLGMFFGTLRWLQLPRTPGEDP